jgi:ferricrocin synthase
LTFHPNSYCRTIFDENEVDVIFNLFQHLIDSCIRYPASSPLDIQFQSNSLIPIQSSRLKLAAGGGKKSERESSNDNFSLSPVETTIQNLLGLFCNVPRARITRDTTIYHLGIDSIGAIQFASKLSAQTKKRFLAADILGNPKVSDLALMVEQSTEKQTAATLEHDFTSFETQYMDPICKELYIDAQTVEAIRACTPVQAGLIAQFMQSGSTYVNFLTYSLDGEWGLERLQSALVTVANHHSILRCGFAALDHIRYSYAMIIYKAVDDGMVTVNGERKSSAFDLAQWRRDATAVFHKNLHMPPWRALFVQSTNRIEMHLALCHAVYDAQCLRMLLNDLSFVYNGGLLPPPIPLDPVIGNILASNNSKSEEGFWRTQLGEGVIGESLTNKFPDLCVTRTNSRQKEVYERVCSMSMDTLEALCKAGGITIQAAGQAAWARILSAYLSESVVTYGLVLSGRDALPGYEDVMFPCIVTVPTITRTTPNTSRLLSDIMHFNSQVRRFQFSSLRDIARWSGRSNETLFDTIFSFQKFPGTKPALDWQLTEEYATDEVSTFRKYHIVDT